MAPDDLTFGAAESTAAGFDDGDTLTGTIQEVTTSVNENSPYHDGKDALQLELLIESDAGPRGRVWYPLGTTDETVEITSNMEVGKLCRRFGTDPDVVASEGGDIDLHELLNNKAVSFQVSMTGETYMTDDGEERDSFEWVRETVRPQGMPLPDSDGPEETAESSGGGDNTEIRDDVLSIVEENEFEEMKQVKRAIARGGGTEHMNVFDVLLENGDVQTNDEGQVFLAS